MLVAGCLETAVQAASNAVRLANHPMVAKHAANGATLLNRALYLQQQIDRGEDPDKEKPEPPIKHRHD